MREVRSLTAIRGVAALWVVGHHLTLFFRYPDLTSRVWKFLFMGFTGVDIFFVLSGFILVSVYQDLKISGLPSFALRRILRIYPLHLAVLAIMAFVTYFSLMGWTYNQVDWHTLPEVVLLLVPYFPITHGFWNGVTWSVGVELSCYLLFPLALFLLRRLPTVILVLVVGVAFYMEYHIQSIDAAKWTGLPCILRGWSGFGLGMSLGLLGTRITLPRAVVVTVELGAVALLGWLCFTFNYILVPLPAAALIWMLDHDCGPISRLLSLRFPVFLGKISYSLYLLQFLLFDVFARLWPVPAHPPVNRTLILREIVFFAVLLGFSALANRFIEQPAQRLWRAKKRRVPAPLGTSGQLSTVN